MSIVLMNAIFSDPPCKGGALLLLVNMARYAADDGIRVFPSVARLAKETAQTPRAIRKQLVELQAKGLIEVLHKRFARTTEYRVCVEKLSTKVEPRSTIQSAPKTAIGNVESGKVNVIPRNVEPGPPDSLLDSSSTHQKRADKPKVNPQVKPSVQGPAGEQQLAHISSFLKFKRWDKG